METGREELKFKSYYISDLEQVVRREIEHSASLTNDMQVCLAKLSTIRTLVTSYFLIGPSQCNNELA